ncbi:MAG: hypothetical protein KC933_03845 [Myxococcales bacterium]|nr:hypothetical protein [Myxococcales bacterium]
MDTGLRRGARTAAFLSTTALIALLSGCSGSGAGSCQSNRDCVLGETCISGSCQTIQQQGCQNDEQCALGEYCDQNSHRCLTITIGDPDAGVTADAGTSTVTADGGVETDGGVHTGPCTVDTECGTPPIDICVAMQCVKGCEQPDGLPCTGGLVCDSATGHCVDPNLNCQQDSDCNPPTQICIANSCVFGCALDTTLCQAGEICDTNTGRCVVVQTSCTQDSECSPPMTVCESNQCVPGCGQAGGIQCSGATPFCDAPTGRCSNVDPNACQLDADCTGADEICVNNSCTLRCDAAGSPGCVAPQVCNTTTGRCLQGNLPLGDACLDDDQCATGLCLGLTINATSLSVCSTPCGATSQCPLNFTCGDLGGMSFCLGENLTTPPATWDTRSGGLCNTTTNTCQSGWCNTGQSQCIETCSRNGDCASFGGNCWAYEHTDAAGNNVFDSLCYDPGSGSATGAACAQNGNCRSGICSRYTSVCAQQCCSDADCGATQNCGVYDLAADTVVKICLNKSATSGSAALGATCTAANQCDSEICAPTDPAVMNSPMKCSTLCCRDADCGVLPGGGRCRPLTGPVTGTIVGVCLPN